MKFLELFENCKRELKEQIKNKWLEDRLLWNAGQTLASGPYSDQLDKILDKCLTGDNLLVEDMGEWTACDAFPVNVVEKKYWREWNGDKEQASLENSTAILADKNFLPFTHQAECWEKLLKDNHSICVTSGTGSGKTECFMVPLIKDLADNYNVRHANGAQTEHEPVQAIFLYPLNALMDDQRTRMSECIEASEVDLSFAVYNGNTPDDEDDERRNAITVIEDRRKHEKVLRNEIRAAEHPNILFTNPTMLEYLLLRRADAPIISHSQGKLRWIVIDETHTFSGAGAAELSLLIRRVLDAFGVSADQVRFATSSATVGNADAVQRLKQFISDISGQPIDKIDVVMGSRSLQTVNGKAFQNLHDNGFLTLNEFIDGGNTVEDKLQALDNLCDAGLKVKLHLFAKALNRGLFIDLNNGFGLVDEIPLDAQTGHYKDGYLVANYCQHCGTVFATGELSEDENGEKITRKIHQMSSIFDEVDAQDEEGDDEENEELGNVQNEDSQEVLIALRANATAIASARGCEGEEHFTNGTPFDYTDNQIVQNDNDRFVHFIKSDKCPVCGDIHNPIRFFNVGADTVTRMLAPALLDQAQPIVPNNDNLLYDGRQMISFADSRAKAAKPSLKQNKENEKKWVAWKVFDLICKIPTQARVDALYNRYHNDLDNDNLGVEYRRARDLRTKGVYWVDVLNELVDDSDCDYFANQFANKDDYGNDGTLNEFKKKYVLAALYDLFGVRRTKGLTPETLGQVQVVYPKLNTITELPQAVNDFNMLLHDNNRIGLEDWKDFLSIYIETQIRTNHALFFISDDNRWNTIDITSCRNLRTANGVRRPIKAPKVGNNRYTLLLCRLLGKNSEAELDANQRDKIKQVLVELWQTLKNKDIVERGQVIGNNNGPVYDRIEPIEGLNEDQAEERQGRLNLTNIGFRSPDRWWRCPVTNRVLTRTFKGYSYYESDAGRYDQRAIELNAEDIQGMLEPKLFIQSEHTAQLGRTQTKQRIKDFKDHKINILSCSTTMEMGVDLGSVELVEMTNVPPKPSNYKQRAGRAGRRGQNRSAALTVCGSDGVDALFFNYSKENVTKSINPPTVDLNSPQVVQRHVNSYLFYQWLRSLKAYVVLGGEGETRVIELFTTYQWHLNAQNQKDYSQVINSKGRQVVPYSNNNIRDSYEEYDQYNALWNNFLGNQGDGFIEFVRKINPEHNNDVIVMGLRKLLDGVCETTPQQLCYYLDKACEAMEKVWEELNSYFLTLRSRQEEVENDGSISNVNKEKIGRGLNFDFTSRLKEPLLTYLSNHQFLPNANMPVNIVELKLANSKRDYSGRTENPTYDLAAALGQWAPGNYVTIKDTTYTIGGISRDYNKSYRKIYKCRDCGHTWITQETHCPCCHSANRADWTVNNQPELRLLEPIGFIPTTDRSRITENSQNYTRAKAELIGASAMVSPTRGLFSYRLSESENVASKILIYNDGAGYGYRICKKCGKAKLETGPAIPGDEPEIINDFYPNVNNNNKRSHNDLVGETAGCYFDIERDELNDKIYRNIIIGGLIQTDFCEIGFYQGSNLAISQVTDRNILVTLGVLICSYMVTNDICERNDIDFIVMSNNTLCIYDKAKGGAGYSKQLRYDVLLKAFDYCQKRLENCVSLFQLLDNYTQQYVDQIDIVATLNWLKEERNHRNEVPANVTQAYNNSEVASFGEIEQVVKH